MPNTDPAATFERVRTTGATYVRLAVNWDAVAPAARPAQFRPADPADPAYNWAQLDTDVRDAVAAGLQPVLTVYGAPTWASIADARGLGPVDPNAREYGRFATAIATRYSGAFEDLPRVRYWQAWNEPNLNKFLRPQIDQTGKPLAVGLYRGLLTKFAAAVHAVHRDNVVIAGGLSPFTQNVRGATTAPLAFMRELLCMSPGPVARPTCAQRAPFDVWATNPYTFGGPTQRAFRPDDVSLGNLPDMNRLLRAAVRAHHVLSRRHVQFWVTEFSWDTNPPDKGGVPLALHARWVSEALYRMWASGVSVATWFSLHDQPTSSSPFQSGLWFGTPDGGYGSPKPALEAFRFPFVAFRGRGVLVWGLTPSGASGTVVVQRRPRGGAWRRVATLVVARGRPFTRTLPIASVSTDQLRAVFDGESSRPFSLTVPPAKRYQPFGSS